MVHLTEIQFQTKLEVLWSDIDEKKKSLITLETIKELRYKDILISGTEFFIEGLHNLVDFSLNTITIRNVRTYLNDIILFAKADSFNDKQINILLKGLFVRTFMYDIFEKMQFGITVEKALTFKFGDEELTLSELLVRCMEGKLESENIKEIFSDVTNVRHYKALAILGYSVLERQKEIKKIIENSDRNADFDERTILATQRLDYLKEEECNEQINRILWNLLGNGNSEYSDMEAFITRLKQEVLFKNSIRRREAWNHLCNDAYYTKIRKNNTTLFKIGIDRYLPIFQALRVVGAKDEEWISWLEFYFEEQGANGITVEMIENLNYCDVSRRKIYQYTITQFCKCTVKGNFKDVKGYSRFLSNYLGAIFRIGYSDNYVLEPWRFEEYLYVGKDEQLFEGLCDAKKALQNEIEMIQYEWLKSELQKIIEFIDKLIEINSFENTVKAKTMQIKSSMESRRTNQEEIDRLKEVYENKIEDFENELIQSYNHNKISPRDIREIQGWDSK